MKGRKSRKKLPHGKRPWLAFLQDPPDSFEKTKKITAASLLVALLLNVLFFAVLPLVWKSFPEPKVPEPVKEFQIEFDPSDMRFVETNPDVDVKEPVDTNNYSSRSQVAAQEKRATKPVNETPSVDGDMKESQKVITGSLEEPEPVPEFVAAQEPSKPQTESQYVPEEPPIPNPDLDPFFKDLIEDQEGEGSVFQNEESDVELAKTDEPEVEKTERIINVNQPPQPDAKPSPDRKPANPMPRPRPQVVRKAIPGPLKRSQDAASRIGSVAINARFSEFGDYQQRMFESIVYQWHLLGGRTKIAADDYGSVVSVRFIIDRQGFVDNVEVVHSTASGIAEMLCKDAIQSRAPYGRWSRDMVRTLGERQPIQINFHYL